LVSTLDNDDELQDELLRLGEPKNPLVIKMSSFNGMRGLDIRRHYFDKKEGITKPTAKGIWLKETEFKNILNFLNEHSDKIVSFFKSDLDAAELSIRSKQLLQNSKRKNRNEAGLIESELKSWPGTNFFECVESGNKKIVRFNSKIKLLASLDADTLSALAKIIFNYNKAKHTIGTKGSDQIFNSMELEWGNLIHHSNES